MVILEGYPSLNLTWSCTRDRRMVPVKWEPQTQNLPVVSRGRRELQSQYDTKTTGRRTQLDHLRHDSPLRSKFGKP